jgi:hypothetical protein
MKLEELIRQQAEEHLKTATRLATESALTGDIWLRHIHRDEAQKQQASFCCHAYHKGDSGRCDKLVFAGFDPVLSSVQAQHWADENWPLYDHIDVLDSSGRKIYGR